MARMAGLEETLRQTSAALVRARASRDEYKARVRKLQGAVEATRKHADSVAAEQAAKTAALREEAVVVRQQLANAVAVQKELPAAREAATDAENAADYLRRLAEGNAAYGRLRAECEEHKKSLEVHKGKAKADALLQHDWDRLCRWFYQSSKGRPVTESERQILTRWVTWRREQNQQKQAQQARKKAGKK